MKICERSWKKIVFFHTINGKIHMKQSAWESETISNNESDTGTGNWLIIDSQMTYLNME